MIKWEIKSVGNNTDIKEALNEQYKTSENLNIRGNLHSYNTNKTDWNNSI